MVTDRLDDVRRVNAGNGESVTLVGRGMEEPPADLLAGFDEELVAMGYVER